MQFFSASCKREVHLRTDTEKRAIGTSYRLALIESLLTSGQIGVVLICEYSFWFNPCDEMWFMLC